MTKTSLDLKRNGYTLLEMTVSFAILSVVGLLSAIAINTSASTVAVADAKTDAQASVRDTLAEMTHELQMASKQTNAALTPALQALTVVNPQRIVFQVPADTVGATYSAPITYAFINEDTGAGKANNALLDTGEDTNTDKALTRCVQRTQGGARRAIGAANNVSAVTFALNAKNDVLTITLTATKAVNNRRHSLVSATATSQVYLHN